MKTHYVINGHVPSDINAVEVTTYKFQKLGHGVPIYIWVALEHSHGIGSGLKEFGSSDKEAELMHIINFLDTTDHAIVKHIYTDDFNEIVETREKIIRTLTPYLRKHEQKEIF